MLRSKLLCALIISGALLFASCSDSGTDSDDPDDPGNGGDPVDPTASIDNPNDGDNLEGEITLIIGGEAEDGFDELRISIGDEEVETVSNPGLPYEYDLATYDFDNGDYDLEAELDPSGEDTTVEASISSTFENYMVTLETDNYIANLKDSNDAAYLFISDPDGNVLREMELTAETDGTLNILPPEAIEGEAPEHYVATIGRKATDPNDNDIFSLDTDVGLESWSTIHKSSSDPVELGETTFNTVDVEMSNFNQEPRHTFFSMENYGNDPQWPVVSYNHFDSDLNETISIPEGSEDLVIVHTPDYENVSSPVPVYKWEENPGGLENPKSYNVGEEFSEMIAKPVSAPSNVNIYQYGYYMTVAPDSFDEGDIYFAGWNTSNIGDANGSDSGFGIWVPEITKRSFLTHMFADDQSDPNVSYSFQSAVMEGFPDEFHVVEADVQVNNQSMDNLDLDINGSADYIRIEADASTASYTQEWSLVVPDTTQSFVYPKIADSLDQSVTNYNRSDFEFTSVVSVDYGKFDNGYSSYLESQYGTTDFGIFIEWANKTKALNTSSSKAKPGVPYIEQSGDSRTSSKGDLQKSHQHPSLHK